MNELHSFLENISNNSDFNAELCKNGGYITFSNSGRRGGVKYFQIGLDNIIQTLRDILAHLDVFQNISEYEERAWRDNGAEYFTDPVANANSTVQTKPLFSTLSKIIIWGNQPNFDNIDPDQHIVLSRESVQNAIEKLKLVSNSYTPRKTQIIKPLDGLVQVIYYGCPGSGKSHKVKKDIEGVNTDFVFRTTFHPDTDYASFVGCYKPCSQSRDLLNGENISEDELLQRFFDSKDENKYKGQIKARYLYESLVNCADIKRLGLDAKTIAIKLDEQEFDKTAYTQEASIMYKIYDWLKEDGYITTSQISYQFCPQVFTNAYVQAWKNTEEKVYLIIEEINRGNCAQIFGDLFQLLDRGDDGFSEYPIKADKDLADYLKRNDVLGADHEGIKDGELRLPSNLIIYATMNTSDQSLFPMDSAFKRRWDWEYVPIEYGADKKSYNFIITIGDKEYRWVEFLKVVNEKIYDATNSEDKQMGNFFIKKSIDAATFVNKVMFYLWNEVCKEECGTQRNFFRKGKEGKDEFKFTELFGSNRDTILNEFMSSLNVPTLNKEPENTEA